MWVVISDAGRKELEWRRSARHRVQLYRVQLWREVSEAVRVVGVPGPPPTHAKVDGWKER